MHFLLNKLTKVELVGLLIAIHENGGGQRGLRDVSCECFWVIENK